MSHLVCFFKTQKAVPRTNPVSSRRKAMIKPASMRAATLATSSSGCCIWPATILLIEFTNELLRTPRSHGKLTRMGLVVLDHMIVFLCLSSLGICSVPWQPHSLLSISVQSALVNIFVSIKVRISPDKRV